MSNIIPFTSKRLLPGFAPAAIASAGHRAAKPAKQPVKPLDLSAIATSPPTRKELIRRGLLALSDLSDFMGTRQMKYVAEVIRTGEESQWFVEKMESLAATIAAMPKTYETDGQGDDAICHLHYFGGSYDGYLIEKDIEESTDPAEAQWQAFGFVHWAHMPGDADKGYICLPEIFKSNMELDFHFTPTPLREIKAKHGIECEPAAEDFETKSLPAGANGFPTPLEILRDRVTGAIERGEGVTIVEIPAAPKRTLISLWCELTFASPLDTLVFIQVGDFHETFMDHAKTAAPILNVALTKRGDTPMCGIPVHAEMSYFNRLLELGKTILLANRNTDGNFQITRTLSPPSSNPQSEIVNRQSAFLALPDGYQPGAILYSSWGWEQTNIDFYRIEKRAGLMLTLCPLQSTLKESGFMSGTRLPTATPKDYASDSDVAWGNKDLQNPKPLFKRKLKTGADGKPNGTVISHGWCRLWEGKPMNCSWYA